MAQSCCPLCEVNAGPGREQPLLFSNEPALTAYVSEILNRAGQTPQVDGGLFWFLSADDWERAFSVLSSKLAPCEQEQLRVASASVSGLVGASRFRDVLRLRETDWFEAALASDSFVFHFQPIVDLEAGTVHGYECLVRLFADRAYLGDAILDAASRRGTASTFDAYLRTKAIREGALRLKVGTKIFINFLPSSIGDPETCLQSTMDAVRASGLRPQDIVFEVVETDQTTSTEHLRRIRDHYHASGFGFALDDLGTGSNSLQLLAEFEPDYVKLDKSLAADVRSPTKLRTVTKLVELSREIGTHLVAEGVENAETARVLRDAGVNLMQGWYFGRPGPAMNITSESIVNLALAVAHHQPSPALLNCVGF